MRTYQKPVNNAIEQSEPESLKEPSKPVRNGKAKRDFVDITGLIRSIQRVEGNPDCFRQGKDDCNEVDCAWRRYCLEIPPGAPVKNRRSAAI